MKGVPILTKIVHKKDGVYKGTGLQGGASPYKTLFSTLRAFVKLLFHSSVKFYCSKIWSCYFSFNIAEVKLHC